MCTLLFFFLQARGLWRAGRLALGSPQACQKSLHIGDSYYSTGGSEIALLRVARERMTSPMLPITAEVMVFVCLKVVLGLFMLSMSNVATLLCMTH